MAESKANRVSENGIWRYLDQDDAELVLMSSCDYPVEYVDDFIDGLHGVTIPSDTSDLLRWMRHDALQAHISKNIPLMEAHLRGLHMACRAAGMLDSAKAGIKHGKEQANRAKKPRAAKADNGESIPLIISRLASSPEFAAETALQLWTRFYGELDRLGLSPDCNESDEESRKWAIAYDYKGGSKTISCGRFQTLVSKERNSKSR